MSYYYSVSCARHKTFRKESLCYKDYLSMTNSKISLTRMFCSNVLPRLILTSLQPTRWSLSLTSTRSRKAEHPPGILLLISRTDRVLFSAANQDQFKVIRYISTPTLGSDHRYNLNDIRPVILVCDIEIKSISAQTMLSYIDNVQKSSLY